MEFPSKIFIDGGDPAETKEADALLKAAGYHGLDGQTTNPTLIAKRFLRDAEVASSNSRVLRSVGSPSAPPAPSAQGSNLPKLPASLAFDYYRKTVGEMSRIIPHGQISIQVIGDPAKLTVDEMLSQARDRITWIPNAVIKFPVTKTGLKAAEIFCQEGPVNMTLAFSQEQAAAVFAASKAHNYDVFISPFVGRLDDRGENGMDVVANILEMYREFGDGHARLPAPEPRPTSQDEVVAGGRSDGGQVQVLTASVRSIKHILYALWLKSDVITIPFKVFKEWATQGFPLPAKDFLYDVKDLTDIPYRELTLDKEWTEYDLSHDLTDTGLMRFWEDWKAIVAS